MIETPIEPIAFDPHQADARVAAVRGLRWIK